MNPDFNQIKAWLDEQPKIVVITHHNPDGDAIGSVLSVKGYLEAQGHAPVCLTPNNLPDFLKWLPGAEDIVVGVVDFKQAETALEEAQLIFCLDFNAQSRVGKLADALAASSARKVLIDHHLQPESFADWMMCDSSASSTGELVYGLITGMGNESLINKDIATNLFAAIATDTGCFLYDSTTAKAHQIAADLKEKGVDTSTLYDRIYNAFTESRVRFFGHCMLNNLSVQDGVAYMFVSKQEMQQFKIVKGDTEGLVNVPLQISDVQVSLLFMERDDEIKVSLRSKGQYDVNQIAREHFNGGGHRNAAGGLLKSNLAEAKSFLDSILSQLSQTATE